jgi:hypothetical protein
LARRIDSILNPSVAEEEVLDKFGTDPSTTIREAEVNGEPPPDGPVSEIVKPLLWVLDAITRRLR